MGGMQDHCTGCLVDLAGLDPHEAVLDMINTPDPICTSLLVQRFDQFNAIHLYTIQGDRDTMLEGNLYIARFFDIGTLRIDGPGIDFLWCFCPWVFQYTALNATTPQVLIYRIGTGICHCDGDVVLGGVGYFVVTRHAPFTDRSDDFQIGGQRIDRDIEANLIIAFAGTAVGNGERTFLTGDFDQQTTNQGASQRSS